MFGPAWPAKESQGEPGRARESKGEEGSQDNYKLETFDCILKTPSRLQGALDTLPKCRRSHRLTLIRMRWGEQNWYKPGGTSDQTNHLRFSILDVLRQQRHILRQSQSESHTVRAGRSRGCKRQAGEGILIPGRKI